MIFAFCCLLVLYFLRLWFLSFSGALPSEVYFWNWAQEFKLSYQESPPLIAWLIKSSIELSEFMFGESNSIAEQLIHFKWLPLAVNCLLTPLILVAVVQNIQKKELNLGQLFFILFSPFFTFGAHIVDPGSVFLLPCLICLYAQSNSSKLSDRAQIFLYSIAVVIASYTKFETFVIVLILLMTGLSARKAISVAFASAIGLAPYVLWLLFEQSWKPSLLIFRTESDPFKYAGPANFSNWVDLVTLPLFIWGPVLFFSPIYFVFKRKLPWKKHYLIWSLVPLIYSFIVSLRGELEIGLVSFSLLPTLIIFLVNFRNRPLILKMTLLANVLWIFAVLNTMTQFSGSLLDQSLKNAPFTHQLTQKLSSLSDLRGWELFYELSSEPARRNQIPLVFQNPEDLAQFLFFDAGVPEKDRLSHLAKIDQSTESKNEFHNSSKRRLVPVKGSKFLYISRSPLLSRKIGPATCRFYQNIFKGSVNIDTYYLYRCAI